MSTTSNDIYDERISCLHCKRKFKPTRLQKHQSACVSASRRRPTFDSKRKRFPQLDHSISKSQIQKTKRSPLKIEHPSSKW